MKRLEYDADLTAAKARQRILVEGIERGAVDHHLSAVWTFQSRHHHQKGGFPRARRTDQGDRVTRCHGEADVLENVHARRGRAEREIDVRDGNGIRLDAGQWRGFDETVHGSVLWYFRWCGREADGDVRANACVGARDDGGGTGVCRAL